MEPGKPPHIDEEFMASGSSKIKEDDIEKLLAKAEEILNKIKQNKTLRKFWNDCKDLFALLKDFTSGKYKEVPWWVISTIAFTLLYVANPMDIIPDFIAGIGYMDDAALIALCMKLIELDIRKYQQWKQNNSASNDEKTNND